MDTRKYNYSKPTEYKGVRFFKARKLIDEEHDTYVVQKIIKGRTLRFEHPDLKTCLKKIDMALIKAGKKGLYYIGK